MGEGNLGPEYQIMLSLVKLKLLTNTSTHPGLEFVPQLPHSFLFSDVKIVMPPLVLFIIYMVECMNSKMFFCHKKYDRITLLELIQVLENYSA